MSCQLVPRGRRGGPSLASQPEADTLLTSTSPACPGALLLADPIPHFHGKGGRRIDRRRQLPILGASGAFLPERAERLAPRYSPAVEGPASIGASRVG